MRRDFLAKGPIGIGPRRPLSDFSHERRGPNRSPGSASWHRGAVLLRFQLYGHWVVQVARPTYVNLPAANRLDAPHQARGAEAVDLCLALVF